MILLVRFRAILGLQFFSRAWTRSLIWICSQEHPFLNFRAGWWPLIFSCSLEHCFLTFRERSLLKLFIRPIDTTRVISCNFETPTFSHTRSRSLICRCTLVHSFLNFRARSLPIFLIFPNDTTPAICRNYAIPTFFLRALELVYMPFIPSALIFEFSRAITSIIIYLT